MRRTIAILSGYVVFCLAVCVALGFAFAGAPGLLARSVAPYKFYSGLGIFFKIFPSVAAAGFLIACSVSFGRSDSSKSRFRFSPDMFARWRKVIAVGVACAFLATSAEEIGAPLVDARLKRLEAAPSLSKSYEAAGEETLERGDAETACLYAERALDINPDSAAAKELFNKADIARNSTRAPAASARRDGETPAATSEEGWTVQELRAKALEAFEKGDWLDAHYYARTGAAIAGPRDLNTEALAAIAADSWNKLSAAREGGMGEGEKLYARKLEGYSAFMAGDNLKAYYIFDSLSRSSRALENDPDVERYLALSRARVENSAFFTDEAANARSFEDARGVHFALKRADGGVDICNIKGVTMAKGAGKSAQYLRGFEMLSLDARGNFSRSVFAQSAKMLETETTGMDGETRARLGLPDGGQSVPLVLLKSVDRRSQEFANEPSYEFAEGADCMETPDTVMLPMPFGDFELLKEASKGWDFMDIASLFRFIRAGDGYGFPSEIFSQIFLDRALYPMLLLCVFMALATFAWNCRIGEGMEFKAIWIALFPALTVIMLPVMRFFTWLYRIVNSFLTGLPCPVPPIATALALYAVLLAIASMAFLSRRDESAE